MNKILNKLYRFVVFIEKNYFITSRFIKYQIILNTCFFVIVNKDSSKLSKKINTSYRNIYHKFKKFIIIF